MKNTVFTKGSFVLHRRGSGDHIIHFVYEDEPSYHDETGLTRRQSLILIYCGEEASWDNGLFSSMDNLLAGEKMLTALMHNPDFYKKEPYAHAYTHKVDHHPNIPNNVVCDVDQAIISPYCLGEKIQIKRLFALKSLQEKLQAKANPLAPKTLLHPKHGL